MKPEPAQNGGAVASPSKSLAGPANKIRSMTGYAEARADCDGWQVRVSLRSVNHRFLDLRIRVSEGFEFFEPTIRQLARERLRRGHVDITLHVEAAGAAAVEVHHETAEAYLRAAEQLRRD